MDYSFKINKIDRNRDIINIDSIQKLESGDKYYDDKIVEYINNLAETKYFIEITKFCGYSHLMVVYKEDSLLDLYIDISKQLWCNKILGLFGFIKKNRYDGTLDIKKMPLTANMTIKEFVRQNKLRPIESIQRPCVFRVFIDDGPKEPDSDDSNYDSD